MNRNLILLAATLLTGATRGEQRFLGWQTNGAAVYQLFTTAITNMPAPENTNLVRPIARRGPQWTNAAFLARVASNQLLRARVPQPVVLLRTNSFFEHYLQNSLNYKLFTNFCAHTNGRTTRIWATRFHPVGWPRVSPVASWDTNCILHGMRGMTALSPCWSGEGSPGQVPITALTRRHGYTRGHSMGPEGFNTNFAGQTVWFLKPDNTVVEVKVLRNVVRTSNADYTILLFDRELPKDIVPIRVASYKQILQVYPAYAGAPRPLFKTEQGGHVSTEVEPLTVNAFKGGDSGSPNLLPMPGEIVHIGGRGTSSASPEMQSDMDDLCQQAGLEPSLYQLQWFRLDDYPRF